MIAQLRALGKRAFGFFRGRTLEARIDEELRFHLEMLMEENRRSGMNPDDARSTALRSLGGIDQAKEQHRDVRTFRLVGDFFQDLRFGARMLCRKPKFAFAAIVILALAIGPNTAFFSIMKGVHSRYLPSPDPDRFIRFTTINPKLSIMMQAASFADFEDYDRLNHTLESAAYYHYASADIAGPEKTERIWGIWTTASLFKTLKRGAALGRVFTADESRPGANPVVVISDSLWKSRFSSDPNILGKTLSINRIPHTVIGVMPADFAFPEGRYKLWLPLEAAAAQSPRDYRSSEILARLKPGASLESAQRDLSRIAAILEREYPATNDGYGILLEHYGHMDLPKNMAAAFNFAYLAVGFVLLIACANISTLLLAKASGRNQEIAIRASIGGSRNRLLRQLLTESFLISALGGILGILVAFVWLRGTLAIAPDDMPNRDRIGLDGISLIYTAGIAFLSNLIFGILPALRSTGESAMDALKEGVRASAGRTRHNLLNGFIILETAMAVVLLVGSSLLARSYLNEISINPGFDRENLLAVQLELPESKYGNPEELTTTVENTISKFKELLGSRMVSATQKLPMAGGLFYLDTFSVQDQPISPANQRPSASGMSVTPDYFRTLRIPLLQGRHFSDADSATHPVAIISETIAKHYLGDTPNPIGRRIRFDHGAESQRKWMEIVGIVGDVHVWNLRETPVPQIYMPYAQQPTRLVALVARTGRDPLQYAAAAKSLMRSIDPGQPPSIQTMEEIIDSRLSGTKMLNQVIGSVTVFALVLAALGIYSVISYAVSERTHEIGIRLAFGAQKSAIFLIILSRGFVLLGIGLGLGVAGAHVLMKFLRMLWFGVTPNDPISYVATGAVLLTAGMLAMILPAKRAMAVDPLVAIRHE